VVGYGKQLKWFSVPRAYKQVGGFKAILISFQVLELGNVLDYHSFIINYAWVMNLLPIPALDGGHVMFFCMKLSAVKTKW
jgi:membrane-associated protease RseP (regulator of RpoE activity)